MKNRTRITFGSRALLGVGAAAACLLFAGKANAVVIYHTSVNDLGLHKADASFDLTGSVLTLTLDNQVTAAQAGLKDPTTALTALFFNVTGGTLTKVSAFADATSSVIQTAD